MTPELIAIVSALAGAFIGGLVAHTIIDLLEDCAMRERGE